MECLNNQISERGLNVKCNNIIITSERIKKDNKTYLKKYIEIDGIKYINSSDRIIVNLKELSNIIIKSFITDNIISYSGILVSDNNQEITLLSEDNKRLTIKSPNINLEYPKLLEYINDLKVIKQNYYEMIDNDQVDKIKIFFNKSENNNAKSIYYRKNSKQVIIIVLYKNILNLEEIEDFVSYFILKNKILDTTDIIDINDFNYRKKYKLEKEKSLYIKGKEMIKYIERRILNERDNNGKISKFM